MSAIKRSFNGRAIIGRVRHVSQHTEMAWFACHIASHQLKAKLWLCFTDGRWIGLPTLNLFETGFTFRLHDRIISYSSNYVVHVAWLSSPSVPMPGYPNAPAVPFIESLYLLIATLHPYAGPLWEV
jgi:hypothetical protein